MSTKGTEKYSSFFRLAGLLATAGLLSVAAWGCGGETGGEGATTSADASSSDCTEGRSVSCTCSSGEEGAQVCGADGTWGSCQCGVDPDDVGDSTGPSDGTDASNSTGGSDTGSTGGNGGNGDANSSEDADSGGPDEPTSGVCCEFENLDSADSVSCRGMEFDRIVNAVDDLGADPTGEDRIDSILEDELTDGTLIVFPEGEYLTGDVSLGGEDVGIIAAKDADPVFVPAEPESELGETLWSYGDNGGLLLQGLDFDYTEEGYGNRLNITPDGPFSICDIDLLGAFPDDTKGFRVDVRDENAEGLLQDAVMTGGPEESTFDWNGIYVGNEHSGTVTIKDCVVANGSNNGLYASSPGSDDGGNGPVRVIGGLYKNNNIAGVRIGSSDSVVRGVDIVVDSEVPEYNGRNARGVRIRDRRGQVIEDVNIFYGEDATTGSGGVSIHSETGNATIRDVRIEMNADGMAAIRGKSPDVGGELGLNIENVDITGSAAGGSAFDISDRPETTVRDSCVHQTGDDRDGIELNRSDDSEVSNTAIEVTGSAIVDDDSSVSTSNISDSAECESPSVASLP